MVGSQLSKSRKGSGISADDPMAEAGRKILNMQFQRMLDNEGASRLGEDVEALHDMRVATRRMRATMRLFGEYFLPEITLQLRAGLKNTAKVLGLVRDWDVLLEKMQAYKVLLPKNEGIALNSLHEAWSQSRILARKKMLDYLESEEYDQLKQDLSAFLRSGRKFVLISNEQLDLVHQVAPEKIWLFYEIVLGHEDILASPTVDQLHALRIDFKRLRYALEFFREPMDVTVEFCIQIIKDIQDHLGDLNDADIAIRRLQSSIDDMQIEEGALPSVKKYLSARQVQLDYLVNTFQPVWGSFISPEFRTNFDQALDSFREDL